MPAGFFERSFVWSKTVWNVLEHSAAYLALIATVKVLVVTVLLSLPLTLAPLIGALVTFAIYANDRLVDRAEDAQTRPARAAFVWQHRHALYVTGALAYGVGVALSALGGPLAFGLTLLPGVVWLLYAMEWLRVGATGFERLKELPVVSSILVSLAWSIPVVALPIAFAGAPLTPRAGVVFVYFVLTTFVSTEIANIRDIESDRASGIETLPTLLGVDWTRTVLYGVATLTLVLLGVGVTGGTIAPLTAAILSVGVLTLVAVLSLFGRLEDRADLTILAEASPLSVFVAIAIVTGL